MLVLEAFFTYDDCPVSREGFNYNYLDLAVDDFDTSKINNGYFIYKNKSEIGCINTKNYNFFKKTTSNQKIIAFIPKESTRAIVITKNNTNAQIENIEFSSLSDENLFWFYKKINILSEKDVDISFSALDENKNKKNYQTSILKSKRQFKSFYPSLLFVNHLCRPHQLCQKVSLKKKQHSKSVFY
jgi:hypothetical protein